MDPKHLLAIQLLTATPLVAIQLRVVYVLARRGRDFNQPFFRLLLFNNIAYLVLWSILHFGENNFPLYYRFLMGAYEPDEYRSWKGAIRYLTNSAAFSTFLGCFFLSLNRLTSIAWPMRHAMLWQKCLPLVYLICVFVPLLSFLGQFFSEARHMLDRNDVIQYYFLDIRNEITSWSQLRFVVVLFELAIALICFFTNVTSTLFIYYSGRISNLREIGAFSANFLAICFFDLAIHTFWLFYDLVSYLNEYHGYRRLHFWLLIVYLFVDNIVYALPATFLVCTNRSVRQAVFSGLIYKVDGSQTVSAVVRVHPA